MNGCFVLNDKLFEKRIFFKIVLENYIFLQYSKITENINNLKKCCELFI